ncbi:MAG: HXXEE domain-containing protein [Bacteroidota bacterium]
MNAKISKLFILIVFLQGLHSIEEYIGKLWESLPPAAFLCGLVSNDLETGFLIINIGLFVVGVLLWVLVVRRSKPYAKYIVSVWIIIELVNGFGHPIWSLMRQSYTPGVITAPFLLITALLLIKQLRNSI